MAWNPSPEVAVARDAARKLGARRCIILYMTEENLGMASYGETKALCNETGKLGSHLFNKAMEYLEAHG